MTDLTSKFHLHRISDISITWNNYGEGEIYRVKSLFTYDLNDIVELQPLWKEECIIKTVEYFNKKNSV